MGTTRIEQAIDEFDPLGDDAEHSCDDIRLAWLAEQMNTGESGMDFDALWMDR